MGQKRLGELFPAFSLYLSIIVAQTNWQEQRGWKSAGMACHSVGCF